MLPQKRVEFRRFSDLERTVKGVKNAEEMYRSPLPIPYHQGSVTNSVTVTVKITGGKDPQGYYDGVLQFRNDEVSSGPEWWELPGNEGRVKVVERNKGGLKVGWRYDTILESLRPDGWYVYTALSSCCDGESGSGGDTDLGSIITGVCQVPDTVMTLEGTEPYPIGPDDPGTIVVEPGAGGKPIYLPDPISLPGGGDGEWTKFVYEVYKGNTGSDPVTIYPHPGGKIHWGAVDAPITLDAQGEAAILVSDGARNQWLLR